MGQELSKDEATDQDPELAEEAATERTKSRRGSKSQAKKLEAFVKRQAEIARHRPVAHKVRGKFFTHDENQHIGQLEFSLRYDVHEETLRIHVIQARQLAAVATSESQLTCLVEAQIRAQIAGCEELYKNYAQGNEEPPVIDILGKEPAFGRLRRKLHEKRHVHPVSSEPQKDANSFARPIAKISLAETENDARVLRSRVFTSHGNVTFDTLFKVKNFKNDDLKTHSLILRVLDFGQNTLMRKPACGYFVLGEIFYPCSKLFKELERVKKTERSNDSVTSSESATKLNAENGQENELAENVYLENAEFTELKEVCPGYGLPEDRIDRGHGYIESWMQNNDDFWRVEHDDAVLRSEEDLLKSSGMFNFTEPDPDDATSSIMDSVSIRYMKAQTAKAYKNPPNSLLPSNEEIDENASQAEATRHAEQEATPQRTLRRNAMVNESMNEDIVLKKVTRVLGGWRYLQLPHKLRNIFGMLNISLIYDPQSNVILVQVVQARDLKGADEHWMRVHVTVEQKQWGAQLQDSAGRLHRFTLDKQKIMTPVRVAKPCGKIKKTALREGTHNPVWNETFSFRVPAKDINTTMFDVTVFSDTEALSFLRLQKSSSNDVVDKHWEAMLSTPKYPVKAWYPIRI